MPAKALAPPSSETLSRKNETLVLSASYLPPGMSIRALRVTPPLTAMPPLAMMKTSWVCSTSMNLSLASAPTSPCAFESSSKTLLFRETSLLPSQISIVALNCPLLLASTLPSAAGHSGMPWKLPVPPQE